MLTTQLPSPATTLPNAPEATIPTLTPVPATPKNSAVTIDADQQRKAGDFYYLDGNAILHYRGYILTADHVTYNDATSELTAEGHLHLTGGRDHEDITASNGRINVDQDTGTFYNVFGMLNLVRPTAAPLNMADNPFTSTLITDNFTELQPAEIFPQATNPFIITGRVVHKQAPYIYQIEGGSMTSCTLPHPNWQITANRMSLNGTQGRGGNALFRLFDVPVMYLPYATHPMDSDNRQTGFMVPVISTSTTNGFTIGEEFYWAINRSTDLLIGLDYLSRRGYSQRFDFRYRGPGRDFINFRYGGLLDRGYYPLVNGVPKYTNQGGEDATLAARHDWTDHTYSSANIEYLSSYVYREAFSQSFLQAISSEVSSSAFLTHERNGMASSLLLDRFQTFESAVTPSDIIRILHMPMLEFNAVEQPLFHTHLNWAVDASAAGLQRHEPGFSTSGIMQRVDIHPRLYGNLHWEGFSFQPEIGMRNTFYTRSQLSPALFHNNLAVEQTASINRKAMDASFEFRPPVLERTFHFGGGPTEGINVAASDTPRTGIDVKHTIAPFLKYNYVGGVANFNNIIRFDPIDILSDTSELNYGLTQRLFLRRQSMRPCKDGETPLPGEKLCRTTPLEWINWTVSQKYFFLTDFGGALINHRRNVIDSSLDFTGVAFLTGPRTLSPIQSQFRVRTTEHTDLEWDLNYDTVTSSIASSNVFADYRKGSWFAGAGDAHLNAPDEVLIQGQLTRIADFNQIRMMLGYGGPQAHGLSAAANYGYDINQNVIEYSAIQTSYNSNCCGFGFEYRHYSLGSIRDENVYRFSLTLNGIGTTGNLRRADRIY